MEAYIADWLHLGFRWFHVIAAITWVGSSFYFNRIDRLFKPPVPPIEHVSGQLWSIHGGAIYNYSRYPIGPGYVPDDLKWSRWESFATWVSGALLLATVYWWGASVNLIQGGDESFGPGAAILISIASIIASWFIYDILCRCIASDKMLSLAIAVSITIATWAFTLVFSPKAAFLHAGIAMATIMAGNVWVIILPGQKRMLQAMRDGTIEQFDVGADAKRRNYHNNYLTLPVVFAMLMAHFPFIYGHPQGWIAFLLISAAGVAVRRYVNTRHAGKGEPRWLVLAAILTVITMVCFAPQSVRNAPDADTPVSLSQAELVQVAAVLQNHCATCHAAQPTQAGFIAPPNGVIIDSLQAAAPLAQRIQQMSVTSQIMPPGNLTQMSEPERQLIARWIAAGAPTQ